MKCSFCNNVIEKGKGTIFVRKDGKTFEFCGSKCEKNMINLGRNPLKVKWTKKD